MARNLYDGRDKFAGKGYLLKETVMKRTVFVTALVIAILFTNLAMANVSLVMNGSFENNGAISDISTEVPQYWCDVNLPANKFTGLVGSDWNTYGSYSLTIVVEQGTPTVADDLATVSQQVYTSDVNEIIFDLRLSCSSLWDSWDSQIRSAIVRLDETVVWDSNDHQPDGYGEYWNQIVDISDVNGIHDANLHTLSLAVRTNKNDTPQYRYFAQWDFVKFDTYCGGFGYLPGDFNYDCYIDANDLRLLAQQWLLDDPNYCYDLFADTQNTVNLYDYTVFADNWLLNSYWENWHDDDCYEAESPDSDINNDGVVDLRDFALLAADWMSEADCVRGDIDCSGLVDYYDVSTMADDWLEKSWLYGLE